MFIFLLAGHEVGSVHCSGCIAANTLTTDHGTYPVLLIWATGTFPG